MPVTREKGTERWTYNEVIRLANGTRHRIKGRAPKHCNTKDAAAQAMRGHRARIEGTDPHAVEDAAQRVTYDEWFNGRFWREWVIGERNKPSEVKTKRYVYDKHLKGLFGTMAVADIGTAEIASARATLVESGLADKSVNNIMAILSKSLNYALDVGVIDKMPRIGFFRIEAPEIEPWDFEEYARILDAARIEGPVWYAAICLAGESGLRAGEVRALDMRKHVDFIARTITVKEQMCMGATTTPKGRTFRTVPMTSTVEEALRALAASHEGYVVRNADGTPKSHRQFDAAITRICKRAGLPLKRWHRLRHTFATHAAMCGVNPYRLQAWLGHKSQTETQRYVHLATAHRRPLLPEMLAAGATESDPDARIIAMLGSRVRSRPRLQLVRAEA